MGWVIMHNQEHLDSHRRDRSQRFQRKQREGSGVDGEQQQITVSPLGVAQDTLAPPTTQQAAPQTQEQARTQDMMDDEQTVHRSFDPMSSQGGGASAGLGFQAYQQQQPSPSEQQVRD